MAHKYNIKVHILNSEDAHNKRIFKEIQLPGIPRIGDHLYVDLRDIEVAILSDTLLLWEHFCWVYSAKYRRFSFDEFKDYYSCIIKSFDIIKSFSLADANCVHDVIYYENDDYAHVILGGKNHGS